MILSRCRPPAPHAGLERKPDPQLCDSLACITFEKTLSMGLLASYEYQTRISAPIVGFLPVQDNPNEMNVARIEHAFRVSLGPKGRTEAFPQR